MAATPASAVLCANAGTPGCGTFLGTEVQAQGQALAGAIFNVSGLTLGVDIFQVGVEVTTGSPNNGTVSIVLDPNTQKMGTWSSPTQPICMIAVKAGPLTAFYQYTPPVTSGRWSTENNPVGQGNNTADLSNLRFFRCAPVQQNDGIIVVRKISENAVGTFDFQTTGGLNPANFQLQTTQVGTAVSQTFTVNNPNGAVFTVSETGQGGATLSNLQCVVTGNNGSTGVPNGNLATITLNGGDTVTCTYTNTFQNMTGELSITKVVNGQDQTFTFTGAGNNLPAALQNFMLSNGQSTATTTLTAGQYVFTEAAFAGYTLDSITCTGDTDAGSIIDLQNRNVSIDLDAGESINCTFTNRDNALNNGTLAIRKVVIGVDQTFTFTGTGNNLPAVFANFGLANGQSTPVTVTPAGQYVISEAAFAGYTLDSILCTGDADNGNAPDVANQQITIDLDPGEDIVCTFTNRQNAVPQFSSITIQKISINGIGSFGFQSGQFGNFTLTTTAVSVAVQQVFGNLQPGQFDVTEIVPAGWNLTSVNCAVVGLGNSTFNIAAATTTIQLAANDAVTCTYTNSQIADPPMEDVVDLFLNRRINNLLSHGPDRARILRRLDPQQPGSLKDTKPLKFSGRHDGHATEFHFSTSLSQMRRAAIAKRENKANSLTAADGVSFADLNLPMAMGDTLEQRWDFWIEGHISSYDDSAGGINRDGHFKILYLGVDYALTARVLVGALVQLDRTDEDIENTANLTGESEGDGWMVGPYVGFRLTDHIYLDARAAWGRSDNSITIIDPVVGVRTGEFDTERWLVSGEITGNWNRGGWRFTPHAKFAYGEETSDEFQSSLGQSINGRTAEAGQLEFGPEIAYQFVTQRGLAVEPHLSFQGIWSFGSGETRLSNGLLIGDEDLRAKAEGGILLRTMNGYSMRIAGSYDGIGADDFEAYGGEIWFNVPLN